jgi:hypothetical protein
MSPKPEGDPLIPMPDTTTPLPLTRSRAEQIFPVLTPAQIGRIAAIGRMHAILSGDVLVEQGDGAIPFFVVLSGDERDRQFDQIVGSSPALESMLAEVERVAPTDSAVLVLGEPKLLRVLQEQEFERLGSGRTHQINVRLVPFTISARATDGRALRFHHGVTIDVHGGCNLSVPHQLLLHTHRSANRIEPRAIGVPTIPGAE